jgi:hypothetical protein
MIVLFIVTTMRISNPTKLTPVGRLLYNTSADFKGFESGKKVNFY